MTNGATMIGRGGMVLNLATDPSGAPIPASTVFLRYEIYSSGIQFYKLGDGESPFNVFEVLGDRPFTVIRGHLSLISLPATPQAVFRQVTLSCRANGLTLGVAQADPFAARGSAAFKDLHLEFTQQATGTSLAVSGGVTLSLFNLDIPLMPVLMGDRGFLFQYDATQATTPLTIPNVGTLTINQLEVGVEVGAQSRRWNGLQALYAFDVAADETGHLTVPKLYDSSGSRDAAGNPNPLDLDVKTVGTVQAGIEGGIVVELNSDIRSVSPATKIVAACRTSNALTIEAWIKSNRTVREQESRPARIVSLSKSQGERNFTLAQDICEKHRQEYQAYIVRLRRTSEGGNPHTPERRNGVPPLITKPGFVTDDVTYVVFTRDADGKAQLYINGTDQADREGTENLSGKFQHWEDNDTSLLLGNERTKDRPWAGEYYQVGIYNRALSEDEVKQSYAPTIQIDASLTLDQVPAPLDVPLPVTISIDQGQLVAHQTNLVVTPELAFTRVTFLLQHTATGLTWASGNITANLWGNEIELVAELTGDRLLLSLNNPAAAPRSTLMLQNLGSISLSLLELSAPRTAAAAWEFRTDGQVTFAVIPPPLQGPLLVRLLVQEGILGFHINPNPPALQIIEPLAFDRADLRFSLGAAGWDVQGNIGVRLFGETRSLVPSFVQEGSLRTLNLNYSVDPSPVDLLTDALGRLDVTQVNLKAVPAGAGVIWQLRMVGRIPLGVAKSGTLAPVLDFQAQGDISGSPARLLGQSRLSHGTEPLFDGDFQGRDNRFLLNGRLTAFPAWSLFQVSSDTLMELDQSGYLRFLSPAQVNIPDFVLLNPQVAMDNGRFTLQGRWLGTPIVLTGIQQEQHLAWQGSVEMTLPFAIALGPIYDPQTLLKLSDRISLQSQPPDFQQTMTVAIDLELSPSGFLATTRSQFPWKDELKPPRDLTIPEFLLHTPPPTRQVLLGQILQELKTHSHELLAPHICPSTGYGFARSDSADLRKQGMLYWSDRPGLPTQATETLLPQLLTTAGSIAGQELFQLTQSATECKLTLYPSRTPEAILAAYTQFLAQLSQSEQDGDLRPGAVGLLKQRIAERLPMPLSQMLYYYYGLDSEAGCLDLQEGMRLRLDHQQFQELPISDRTTEKGFVGTCSSYISVTSQHYPGDLLGAQPYLLGFDPFLAQLPFQLDTDATTQGAGGIVDIQKPAYRQPYVRLFYPPEFVGLRGRVGPERAVTLVSAQSLSAMAQATRDYHNNGRVNARPDRASFFFRGRTVVVPEIAIFIREQPVFVPIGTTLRHLLERYSGLPTRLDGDSLQGLQARVRPRRLMHEGSESVPIYHFIRLDSYQRYGDGTDVLDMPVVKGDRFFF